MLPEIAARAAPSLDSIPPFTSAKAARVEERCGHVVVGYVLQHRALAKRSVVVDGAVRWFPNDDEFQRMMGWQKYMAGPGVPHEGWPVEESPTPVPAVVSVAAPVAPARPVLTAPPSARLLENTEEAFRALAADLGCVFNDMVPHNAGWFVPGKPTAYASAYDAIRGLVGSLKAGGTVWDGESTPASGEAESHDSRMTALAAQQQETPQGAFF
jgi:hypothetical protein